MEPKFKKGDKVYIKNANVKAIYLIREIEITKYNVVYYLDTIRFGWKENELELVQEETRKIIGYKVPFDIPELSWNKGDIAYRETYMTQYNRYYVKGLNQSIPNTIIETWEPVYEEVKPKTIFERVNSFEDACKELGLDCGCVTEFYTSFDKLKTICKALNEGWVADWDDIDQKKYYVFWDEEIKKFRNTFTFDMPSLPKSLHLKSNILTGHLVQIASKELKEFIES